MPKRKVPVELPVANGQVIAGRYVVSGVIGRGGMGIVLAGRHLELGEKVAIKFLHREHAAFADRFFREARAAARIRSEHVVRIFDVGRLPSGEPYIVMEYLEGEDLDSRVERLGTLPTQFVADTLLDVCQALAEAHAAGIVHRDLKPANIFLAKTPGRDALVKLLDFGVAKVPDGGAITKTASVLGSPIYMSPEQLMATRDVDARSDIWSLGVILYELLTGEYPFEGDSLVHLAMVIREKETPKARDLRPDVPEGLDAIIGRCLQKDRNDRFRDVGEFAQALVDFASPAVSHSISRIKRIVEEKRERLALASTEADEDHDDEEETDDEDLASTAHVPSHKEEAAVSAREPVSGSGSSREKAASPLAYTGSSPLTASLAAVSASTTNPSAEVKKRRARMMRLAVVGAAGLVGLVSVGRLAFGPATTNTQKTETGASLVAEAAALPAPSAPITSGDATTPAMAVASTSAPPLVSSPATTSVAAPVVRPAIKPVTAPAKSAAIATPPSAPPLESCDPPWTIDENGIKRLKKHCK